VLGPRKFEPELASRTSVPGVATGMAYTPVGGEILFIEASRMPGKGKHHADRPDRRCDEGIRHGRVQPDPLRGPKQMGIDPKLLAESDIHIHVPAGAFPRTAPAPAWRCSPRWRR
jgi:ATP-dependent Lon protease